MKVRFPWISFTAISIIIYLVVGYFTNNDSVALFGTGFATVLLAAATYKMVDEMRASRIEQSRPYIFVDFDIPYGEQLIHIVAKNIGGAAKNVKFKFDPELIDSSGRIVSNGAIFKNGIDFFPPNKEIKQFFDSAITYFESGKPLEFSLTVTYFDHKKDEDSKEAEKHSFEETFNLDLSTFKDLQFVERKGLHDIAESMEQLAKDMRSQFKSHTSPKIIKEVMKPDIKIEMETQK